MKKLLTLNTMVPNGGPAEPVLVFHDDGKWEIAYAGDVDYIRNYGDTSESPRPTYVGNASIADILDSFLTLIGKPLLDRYGLPETHLFVSETIPHDVPGEPMVAVYLDGGYRVMTEWMASRDIEEDSNLLNYIPLIAVVEDFRQFRAKSAADAQEWASA